MNPEERPSNYWQPDQKAQPSPATPAAPQAPVEAPLPEPIESPAPQPQPEQAPRKTPPATPVTWQAEEYINLHKGAWWFVVFAVVVAALIALDIFFLKSWTFTLLVVVMAVAVVVFALRPPRMIQYTLSAGQGLYIGEQLYQFADFKAFGVVKDGDYNSIMLIPRKRFSPGVSVYFPEQSGETIVDILGGQLPMENLKLDAIDILVRKLRL